jgi:hypothetical protein
LESGGLLEVQSRGKTGSIWTKFVVWSATL